MSNYWNRNFRDGHSRLMGAVIQALVLLALVCLAAIFVIMLERVPPIYWILPVAFIMLVAFFYAMDPRK